MKLKLFNKNNEDLKDTFQRILITSSIIVQHGHLPTNEEINEPERFGRFPYKDVNKDNSYQLCGLVNNDWVNILEESENYIIFEFRFRYDEEKKKKNAISNVILTWFDVVQLTD